MADIIQKNKKLENWNNLNRLKKLLFLCLILNLILYSNYCDSFN
jgi:hypothetical protein